METQLVELIADLNEEDAIAAVNLSRNWIGGRS
jgi:hypothetical protein